MERSLLNIKRIHRIRNTEIRKTTKIIDALEHSQKLKWKWAGHIARMDKEKWTNRVTTWQGPTNKRKRGRPKERWVDEIIRKAGEYWLTKAKDRQSWGKMEEAFTRIGVHSET
ncbi:jg16120 [Pararge aegeria aegeria]|uniref:Jg16120 protein n=1 Tax=Pararge aegeria aegeria TaxID=348720 RepID=A0A8S4RFT8_9NEOP|nr:jg16120 [Pararge aegeria aegeria]